METKINKIWVGLSMEEVQMLATELHEIIYNVEQDGKTDIQVTMLKKLQTHLTCAMKDNNIADTTTSYRMKPNN